MLILALLGIFLVRARIAPALRARNAVESIGERLLLACASLAVLVTVGILLSVFYESLLFFRSVGVFDFLFGTSWSPQTAIRADQVGASGSFGAVPLFLGTAMISGIAMLIAVPVGLFSAIYLAEYAHSRFRSWAKPLLEVLAGIPTVVYGFFAALTVGPALRSMGEHVGFAVASESALAAGLVMGIMIIPFVSSLADDMIRAGAAGFARWSVCAGRDAFGNHPPDCAARGPARHCRWSAAGGFQGHRRNHDRGDGGGAGGQSDGQPIAGCYDGHGTDSHLAHR